MGSVYIIQGILIYIYAFDHNPPHIHVRSGGLEFEITIKERIVTGTAKAKDVAIINKFIDEHEAELLEIWEQAQQGKPIKKIER
jgi:hypothetical protein